MGTIAGCSSLNPQSQTEDSGTNTLTAQVQPDQEELTALQEDLQQSIPQPDRFTLREFTAGYGLSMTTCSQGKSRCQISMDHNGLLVRDSLYLAFSFRYYLNKSNRPLLNR